jgi:hypothetical protein
MRDAKHQAVVHQEEGRPAEIPYGFTGELLSGQPQEMGVTQAIFAVSVKIGIHPVPHTARPLQKVFLVRLKHEEVSPRLEHSGDCCQRGGQIRAAVVQSTHDNRGIEHIGTLRTRRQVQFEAGRPDFLTVFFARRRGDIESGRFDASKLPNEG